MLHQNDIGGNLRKYAWLLSKGQIAKHLSLTYLFRGKYLCAFALIDNFEYKKNVAIVLRTA